MGLRTRIVLFVLVTVFAGHLGWGLILSNRQAEALRDDAEDDAEDVLRALAGPCAVPLATRQVEQLDRVFASFELETEDGRRDIQEIAVLDAEGYVAAHTDPAKFGRKLQDSFTLKARAADGPFTREVDGRLYVSLPIVSGLRWGTVTAIVSLERVQQQVSELRRDVLLSGFFVAVLVATTLYGLLSILALQPLGNLTGVVQRLSSGDLTARAPTLARQDEIALLTTGFNEMAAQIQGYTRSLEDQVAARTAELVRANAELERLARTDGLTGLANHRSLQEALAAEVARAHRYRQPLSLLMIDVDHFKVYNDTNGHPEGDEVLRRIAKVLEDRLRGTDLAARYGGEEFAVILPSTDAVAAEKVAAGLVEAVRAESFQGGQTQPLGRVTISAGGAQLEPEESPDGLLVRADTQLYAAKSGGRDRAVFPRGAA